ncbi:PREDICTED: cytochrome b-c1 complex subunit 2, mitochondrial [Polistes dominula]|uniref:Cytochrome b-c1 complex subunit 2, mitochondrial n=1 Tax=Polistes dominula TaxID=743375 RepID=A0ABM1I7N7_POLDO|nr:PREDICTED: cytochrome b-c1 complex subunit 2, mitochondrial [Polistes dominula]
MACSAVRSPILRNSTVRHYATATAAQACSSTNLESKTLNNKVFAVALENNSPISQISIVFRAGPRNETYHNQGISHHLRILAGLTTCRSSYFAITRNIQQLGGNIIATSDRESIAYTLQVTRNNLNEALRFLEDVATQQVFKPWEIPEQLPRLRYELSTIPETTRVLELLHRAAYRTGLGNSLFSPKRQVGRINSETLQHFVNTWFTGSRCSVVATGAPFSEICSLASNLNVKSDNTQDIPTKYHGGELRKERNSSTATVAVAVESTGLNKEKDALALAVLQRAIGTGPQVKWGSSMSPIYKSASSAAGKQTFAISALNAVYSDSGLFGFIFSSEPSIAGSLTTCAYKWLKSPQLSDADISRGKNILKADILYSTENEPGLLEILQQQALHKGTVYSPKEIVANVDKITANDVKSIAGKLGSGKTTLAAIGDICSVPNLDELS